MVDLSDIYIRQKDLPISIPKCVTVIGVGGIGSWVALSLALLGVKRIILIDNDIIEIHNLNRTPFMLSQLDVEKTIATSMLILERRVDCDVITITKRVNNLNEEEKELVLSSDIIFDCRDSMDKLPIDHNKIIMLRYDGEEFLIIINPDYDKFWGEGAGYRTIPSYVGTPLFLTSLTIALVSLRDDMLNKKHFEIKGKLSKVIEILYKNEENDELRKGLDR